MGVWQLLTVPSSVQAVVIPAVTNSVLRTLCKHLFLQNVLNDLLEYIQRQRPTYGYPALTNSVERTQCTDFLRHCEEHFSLLGV